MNQPDLFTREPYGGHPPHNGTEPSIEAARMKQSTAAADRLRILAFILDRAAFGATCDEVEEHLGLRHQTASARIAEMSNGEKPVICRNGMKRPTRTGIGAYVMVAVCQ